MGEFLIHLEVLRLGHRIIRDERITTHLALISRIFSVKKYLIAETEDKGLKINVNDLIDIWGGTLEIITSVNSKKYIKKFKKDGGFIVHLTMYGERITEKTIKNVKIQDKILIILGSKKVDRYFYENADLNLSIGNQPHSELSALTILLYELKDKDLDFLYREFQNAKKKIIPSKKSKKIIDVE